MVTQVQAEAEAQADQAHIHLAVEVLLHQAVTAALLVAEDGLAQLLHHIQDHPADTFPAMQEIQQDINLDTLHAVHIPLTVLETVKQ